MSNFYFNSQYLQNTLATLDIKPTSFAKSIGISKKVVFDIIKGKYPVRTKTGVFETIEEYLKKAGVTDIDDFYKKPETIIRKDKGTGEDTFSHFGFESDPFRTNTADIFMNEEFNRVVGLIRHAVENNEFRAFVGRSGTGKSTLLRYCLNMLRDIPYVRCTAVLPLDNLLLDPYLLMDIIVGKLGGIDIPYANKRKSARLQQVFLAAHDADQKLVVFIDEAQTLTQTQLKQLRLLHECDLDNTRPPLSLILFGQPQFSFTLANPALGEVSRRMIVTELDSFGSDVGKAAIIPYMQSRLNGKALDIFTPEAIDFIMNSCNTYLDVNTLCRAGMTDAANNGDPYIEKEHIQGGLRHG